MARGHLVLALALAGCDHLSGSRSAILPTQLSLLVEDGQGQPLSLVMDLRRNSQQQLDVRVSEGVRIFDGEHVWLFSNRFEGGEHVTRLSDERAGRMRDLPFRSATEPALLAVVRMDAWFATEEGVVRCSLLRPVCGRDTAAPPPPMDHDGPGQGFRAWVTDQGQLRLTLPLDQDDSGQPILDNVRRVIGVHWVHEGFLARDPMLDKTFRGRGSILASHLSVRVDGELAEWDNAEPLIVDSPWQIEAGAEEWQGASDAGFSVTASRSEEGACFAGRVRDDHFEPGDELTLVVGGARLALAMSSTSSPAATVREEWYGRRFEACVALTAPPERLSFSAVYSDADGKAPPTLLASAPATTGSAGGVLHFSP